MSRRRERTLYFHTCSGYKMGIKLIGIHGKAGAGKDALASAFIEDHGFVRLAFADSAKRATAEIFGWTPELMHNDDFKKSMSDYWGITVRQAMQKFGTEAVRGTFGNDHWVKRWNMDYAKLNETFSVIVPDVREDIEADFIRGLGGLVIHINRPGAGLAGFEAAHSSERGIRFDQRQDIRIANDGTLRELQANAHKVITFIEQSAADFNLLNKVKA